MSTICVMRIGRDYQHLRKVFSKLFRQQGFEYDNVLWTRGEERTPRSSSGCGVHAGGRILGSVPLAVTDHREPTISQAAIPTVRQEVSKANRWLVLESH